NWYDAPEIYMPPKHGAAASRCATFESWCSTPGAALSARRRRLTRHRDTVKLTVSIGGFLLIAMLKPLIGPPPAERAFEAAFPRGWRCQRDDRPGAACAAPCR